MTTRTTRLPRRYHDAVVRWSETYLPDYDLLLANWEKHFPKDPPFELCAYRELGMCDEIECGAMKGRPKFGRAGDMEAGQASHLLAAIKAQASTEFGSIQQHQLTLARAAEEEDQFWILRMMAEELRHGYQMLHLLVEDDFSAVAADSSEQMVEQILSMRTGSHVLGAFNIDFDSFIDSIVFCAVIDRVGKYQLALQKVSAYKPMAESMPPMLREEAFHLMAGVIPLRRWVGRAARGEGTITLDDLQRTLNKWVPRGLEMFGDERGGDTNVRYGLKPMRNAEAQEAYYRELGKVVRGLNLRALRERFPQQGPAATEALLDRLERDRGSAQGVSYADLLKLPDPRFFRRRGVPAFGLVGHDGETHPDAASYLHHLGDHLPPSYRAGRDYAHYAELLVRVHAGELEADRAGREMPALRRVGGVCPCSKAVRWVVDEPAQRPCAAP